MKTMVIVAIAAAIAVAVAVGVAAMSSQNQPSPSSTETEKVKAIASFFPLYDFARHVGGERAEVSVMVPAGVEPHDWDPTPRDIANAENADLIVYNGAGFESWVSDLNANNTVDTSRGVELMEGGEHEEEEGEAREEEEHEESGLDPHIWLDPIIAKQQVESIRDGLIQVDSANADYYSQNADRYLAELDSLDALIKSELLECEKTDFIAFHNAFGYFAKRYGLTQHSVHGVSPEGEVLPQRISEIKRLATELGIEIIYAEELVDPRLANVIAEEIQNGRVLVLSPIEGLEEEEIQQDLGYLDKMKENLENLKVGLDCS